MKTDISCGKGFTAIAIGAIAALSFGTIAMIAVEAGEPAQAQASLAKEQWVKCRKFQYGLEFVPFDDTLTSGQKAGLMAEFEWELQHGTCRGH